MKTFFKSAINIILYLVIFLGVQLLYQFIYLAITINNNHDIINYSDQQLTQFLSDNINYMLIPSSIISIIVFLVIYRIKNKKKTIETRFFTKIPLKDFIFFFIIGAGCNFLISLLISIFPIKSMKEASESSINVIINTDQKILTLIAVGILAPITEEILFRGLIFEQLKRFSPLKVAIVIQAIIFGLCHYGNTLQMIYASILGIFLGVVVTVGKSLYYTIMIHMAVNTTSVIGSFFLTGNKTNVVNVIYFVICVISIICVGLSIPYLKKRNNLIKEETKTKNISLES